MRPFDLILPKSKPELGCTDMNYQMAKRPRGISLAWILGGLMLSTGCAMCCGPYDFHYTGVGGALERSDPEYGRVGSILSDPWMAGHGPSADSNLKPHSTERSMTAQSAAIPNRSTHEQSLTAPMSHGWEATDAELAPPQNSMRSTRAWR